MNKEIIWNLINSLLAGLISLTSSSLAQGEISARGLCIAFIVALGVAVVQFKNFWDAEKPEYCSKIFNFIKV